MELDELLDRVPEGWTSVRYDGRRWSLTRTTRADGRSVSLLAEQLGGPDLVSANVYRTADGALLRPCEMPDAKVLAFLRGWTAVPGAVPVPVDDIDGSGRADRAVPVLVDDNGVGR